MCAERERFGWTSILYNNNNLCTNKQILSHSLSKLMSKKSNVFVSVGAQNSVVAASFEPSPPELV